MHILLFILIFYYCHFRIWPFYYRLHTKNDFRIRTWFFFITPETNGIGTYKPTGLWPKRSPFNDDEEEIYSENVPEKRHKKIFTQDDGEYVDFEEIK